MDEVPIKDQVSQHVACNQGSEDLTYLKLLVADARPANKTLADEPWHTKPLALHYCSQ